MAIPPKVLEYNRVSRYSQGEIWLLLFVSLIPFHVGRGLFDLFSYIRTYHFVSGFSHSPLLDPPSVF